MREIDEDVFRTAEELGIDISRPERGTDEDDRDASARRRTLQRRTTKRETHHMLDVNMFDQLKIGLATADQIRTVVARRGEEAGDHQLPHAAVRRRTACSARRSSARPATGSATAASTSAVRFKGIICERCGVEVTRSKVPPRADGPHRAVRPRSCTSGTSAAPVRGWPTSSPASSRKEELKAKQLEKVIYFAANLVTWVDEEQRHDDLVEPRGRVPRGGATRSRKELELAIDRRYKELEDEAARAREPKAPRTPSSKNQRAEKEVAAIRERYEIELDLRRSARGTSSGACTRRKIIDDELLWRELRDRYGDYFEGGTGADAIKALIDRIDFDEEEVKLREAIDPRRVGRKPLSRPSASRRPSSG